jgi:hypothetical protein
MTPLDIDKEKTTENQIICPYCKKTISNDCEIAAEGKEAGLLSSFVFCECGEKIKFSAIITQIRAQEDLPQGSKIDFNNLPWLEARMELP